MNAHHICSPKYDRQETSTKAFRPSASRWPDISIWVIRRSSFTSSMLNSTITKYNKQSGSPGSSGSGIVLCRVRTDQRRWSLYGREERLGSGSFGMGLG